MLWVFVIVIKLCVGVLFLFILKMFLVIMSLLFDIGFFSSVCKWVLLLWVNCLSMVLFLLVVFKNDVCIRWLVNIDMFFVDVLVSVKYNVWLVV